MTSLEHAPCPTGCAPNDAEVLVGQDLLHGVPGEFTVVRCQTCGLMRTNPRPTPATIGAFYPPDYGPYLGSRISQPGNKQRGPVRRLLSFLARNIWVPIHNRVFDSKATATPPLAAGNMLEVGCAAGGYLQQMANLGWTVCGVEFSAEAAQQAIEHGFDVQVGQLETLSLPRGEYDLIACWMVLEHLHDPVGGLRKLRDSATDDAWLALSVPNARSREFSRFGKYWYALQLPTHLYHFTPESISSVLKQGGWDVKKICHQRTLGNLVASLGYALQARGYSRLAAGLIKFPDQPGVWRYLLHPIACLFAMLGQTGRMTVWAKPRP